MLKDILNAYLKFLKVLFSKNTLIKFISILLVSLIVIVPFGITLLVLPLVLNISNILAVVIAGAEFIFTIPLVIIALIKLIDKEIL